MATPLAEDRVLLRALLSADEAEAVGDTVTEKFGGVEGFRMVLLAVEATLPRPAPGEEADQEAPELAGDGSDEEEEPARNSRISREELYTDILETVKLSPVYIVLVLLSSVVAAVGLVRGDVAVIIGAMVIAPLLGPNMALSLATTLGDLQLARQSLKVAGAGLAVGLSLSVLLGFVLEVDPQAPQIASRTEVNLGDIALALASGGAGALAFTMGVGAALVGVMVAVALLPPLVIFGMLLGAGQTWLAARALLLLLTNIICVNLAGVTTFLIQGIRPQSWWEADRAKKATVVAICLWAGLLAVLAAVILLSKQQ